jgi:hypothetical protein
MLQQGRRKVNRNRKLANRARALPQIERFSLYSGEKPFRVGMDSHVKAEFESGY